MVLSCYGFVLLWFCLQWFCIDMVLSCYGFVLIWFCLVMVLSTNSCTTSSFLFVFCFSSRIGHKCLYDYGKGKPTNPVSILEQRVAKVFPDGILYSGVIVDYNEQKRWWQISYEDGDEEQLNFRELCILDTPPDFSCFRYCADG